MYDFEKQKWRQLPDVPSKRVFALYTTSGTKIFSLGGLNQNAQQGFSDRCEVFDIEKGTYCLFYSPKWIPAQFRTKSLTQPIMAFQSGPG